MGARGPSFFWYDTYFSEFDSADIIDYILKKSLSCQKNDGRDHARPSFFGHDNDKDLKICFLVTRVIYPHHFHGEITEQFCLSTVSLDRIGTCFDCSTLGLENSSWSFFAFFQDTQGFSGLDQIQMLGALHQLSMSAYLEIRKSIRLLPPCVSSWGYRIGAAFLSVCLSAITLTAEILHAGQSTTYLDQVLWSRS